MKKTISLILAIFMFVSAVPMTAFADDAQMINGIEVNVDTDSMIGLTPDDYEQFIEVITPGIEIRQDKFIADTNNGTANPYIDVYTYGRGVMSTIYLYPLEGYTLPADADELTDGVIVRRKVLIENDVNSRDPEYTIHSEDGVSGDYIEIRFNYAPTGPIKLIHSVDITFDSDIAGKKPEDFMEFFTFNTEGLEIRQETFDAWYRTNNSVSPQRAEAFELGKSYNSTIYVYPKDGYAISGLVYDLPVTIEAATNKEDNVIFNMEYEAYRPNSYLVSGVEISFSYRITGPEPEPTGMEKLFQPIIDFFNAIATFFTETFIQPIVDLIMILS